MFRVSLFVMVSLGLSFPDSIICSTHMTCEKLLFTRETDESIGGGPDCSCIIKGQLKVMQRKCCAIREAKEQNHFL